MKDHNKRLCFRCNRVIAEDMMSDSPVYNFTRMVIVPYDSRMAVPRQDRIDQFLHADLCGYCLNDFCNWIKNYKEEK